MDEATFDAKFKQLQDCANGGDYWREWHVLNLWLRDGKTDAEIAQIFEDRFNVQKERSTYSRARRRLAEHFGVIKKDDRLGQEHTDKLINLLTLHKPDFFNVPPPEPQRETPQQEPTEPPAPVVGNLPSIQVRKSAEFFGRDQILRDIHTKLQEQPRLALVGMGGVGKTEAAVQYATSDYAEDYSGGTWWLSVPQGNIGGQVLSITIQRFQNFPADVYRNLTPTDLAQRCWQEWYGKGRALVVLDDVAHIGEVQNFLPKQQAELVVLLTSRESLDPPLLRLDVLDPIPSLQLLFSAMGKPLEECLAEVTPEERQAPALCQQMGHLPLALELIGKYLKQLEQDEEPLLIPQLILQLEGKGLRHGALEKENYLMNGQRGVAEAFELSWARLRDSAQRLAELLAPYQVGATIPHGLLEAHTQRYLQLRGQDYDSVALQDDTRDLRNRSLLKGNTKSGYSIHPLVHRFFKEKLEGKL